MKLKRLEKSVLNPTVSILLNLWPFSYHYNLTSLLPSGGTYFFSTERIGEQRDWRKEEGSAAKSDTFIGNSWAHEVYNLIGRQSIQ